MKKKVVHHVRLHDNTVEGKVLHTTAGGGTRSEQAAPFHLVPREGLRRIALRFGLGAVVHGAENWKRSCHLEDHARLWCEEAHNHLVEHALKMASPDNLNPSDADDDHLGAIGWAVCVIAYCEERFQKKWTELAR